MPNNLSRLLNFKFVFKTVVGLYLLVGVGHAFAWLIAGRLACASENWFGFFWCPGLDSQVGFGFKYAFELVLWPSHYL